MLASAVGCSDSGSSAVRLDRTVLLPFHNLTGDAAFDRWSRTVQHAVQTMSGARASMNAEGDALLAGASSIGHGTIERDPATKKIRLTLDVIDTSTHKLLHRVSAEDADAYAAAFAVAKGLNPKSAAMQPRNPGTLEAWNTALNASNSAEASAACKSLVSGEPSFSPAYSACRTAEFQRADLKILALRAYENRGTLTVEAQSIAGQWLFQTGQFAKAVEVLTPVAATMPGVWNSVGYSQAMLGNFDAARKALEDYRKFGGDEPNAVDSLGEAAYITGRYEDAEKYFLECAERFPQTTQGRVGKIKAAAARAVRGDRAGAESLAQSVIDPLRKAGQDVRVLERVWGEIILEQDPAAMKKKIEGSLIQIPTRD